MPTRSKTPADDVERVLRTLAQCSVQIGIQAENATRAGSSINNVALGYIFETGDPASNTPPRPWLGPSIEAIKAPAAKILGEAAQAIIRTALNRGSGYNPKPEAERALHRIGLMGQSAAQARIQAGIAPPLSEKTIYARLHRRKGRRSAGSATPLIDTGAFVRSIGYVVKV